MGEVVPAHTSPTLLPPSLALCCHYPVSKCCSASIVVASTVRVKSKYEGCRSIYGYNDANTNLVLFVVNAIMFCTYNCSSCQQAYVSHHAHSSLLCSRIICRKLAAYGCSIIIISQHLYQKNIQRNKTHFQSILCSCAWADWKMEY